MQNNMKLVLTRIAWAASAFMLCIACGSRTKGKVPVAPVSDEDAFVLVSEKDPRYFCLSNGRPYIPIGCNIAAISDAEHLEHYMDELHRNGANFARVWLNSDFFEIQKEYGKWEETSISHIDRLLELAHEYGIKVKMCIESFRMIRPGNNKWNVKASYHRSNGGPFEDMQEYMSTVAGKEEYLRRLSFLQKRYGDNPSVFGWELWNEMNAVEADGVVPWTEDMLEQVHGLFPKNLVMQSLGSLDSETAFGVYETVNRMPANDVLQVHRYLDQGAPLEVCGASADSLACDAVRHMLSFGVRKPVLMAECGAVKPRHTGPHEIYKKDSEGVLLHDFLFAPFFCGAAGPGHMWHWDHYIDLQDVWFQIKRFSDTVKGLDPAAEAFLPQRHDTGAIKVYTLSGNSTILSWCRDSENDWQSEFVEEKSPLARVGVKVNLTGTVGNRHIDKVEVFDPWTDTWTEMAPYANVHLPSFKRSIIIKITLK